MNLNNSEEEFLWQDIQRYSKTIEIDLIGVTDVTPFYKYKDRYIIRQCKGYLSGFEGENVEDKIYPTKIMNDAKSIITIGMSYNSNINKNVHDENNRYDGINRYQVSKFARGIDYHIVLKKKLEQIVDFIKSKADSTDIKYAIYIDTGALPDREIAYRAGLGFFGKNNMIINPKYGSYLFLGHLLINIEIKNNKQKYENLCGDCERCIKACPTNALEAAYCFNAKRCISYNTQIKGDIPKEISKHISKTIYGCDICQDACPYNKNAVIVNHNEFLDDLNGIPHDDLFNLSNRQFAKVYSNRAFAWRGREVLKRNAEILKKWEQHI